MSTLKPQQSYFVIWKNLQEVIHEYYLEQIYIYLWTYHFNVNEGWVQMDKLISNLKTVKLAQ